MTNNARLILEKKLLNFKIDKVNNLNIKIRVAEINRSIDNLEWQLEQLKQKREDLYFINLFDKFVVEKFKNGDYSDEEFDKWAELINEAINEEPTAMGEIIEEVMKNG